jgi:pyrroloquinoline-quinone synthase
MTALWDRVRDAHRGCDVLEHPFYVAWSRGELRREELAAYSGQYAHAVAALADGLDRAASEAPGDLRGRIAAHADEEREHVELWATFAMAVGGSATAAASTGTQAMVDALTTEPRDWAELLLAAYAIESTQGPVAETKLDGLRRFYGISDAWATAYFEVHESRDEDHAAEIRELVGWHAGPGDEERLLVSARRAWVGNWALLDGVGPPAG